MWFSKPNAKVVKKPCVVQYLFCGILLFCINYKVVQAIETGSGKGVFAKKSLQKFAQLKKSLYICTAFGRRCVPKEDWKFG